MPKKKLIRKSPTLGIQVLEAKNSYNAKTGWFKLRKEALIEPNFINCSPEARLLLIYLVMECDSFGYHEGTLEVQKGPLRDRVGTQNGTENCPYSAPNSLFRNTTWFEQFNLFGSNSELLQAIKELEEVGTILALRLDKTRQDKDQKKENYIKESHCSLRSQAGSHGSPSVCPTLLVQNTNSPQESGLTLSTSISSCSESSLSEAALLRSDNERAPFKESSADSHPAPRCIEGSGGLTHGDMADMDPPQERAVNGIDPPLGHIPTTPGELDSRKAHLLGGKGNVRGAKEPTEDQKLWFENCWDIYPRKEGKSPALARFIRVFDTENKAQSFYNGILAYSDDIKKRKTDKQYIKLFTTFIGSKSTGEPWLDYYKEVPKRQILTVEEVDALTTEEFKEYIRPYLNPDGSMDFDNPPPGVVINKQE